MSQTRRVRFNGEAGPGSSRRAGAPVRSILKQAAASRDLRREVVTDFARKPIVTSDGLKIVPSKNPTVPPFRRSRTHRHGVRTFRVHVASATARRNRASKIENEAEAMDREELIGKLQAHFDRITHKSKADTSMLRKMYVNAKLSGLF